MKKLLLGILILALCISFVGCGKEEEAPTVSEEVTPTVIEEVVPTFSEGDVITLANLDEFLDYKDVQFVDLRNFEDKFKQGYISGFENISFFQYLDNVAFTRNGDMGFSNDELTNEGILKNFFNKDKAIVLMCGSGVRAKYVKDALDSIGYTNVFNAGGFGDYAGENKILGDGSYTLPTKLPENVLPFTHVTPKGEKEFLAYILEEAETMDEVRYQYAYIACICRGEVQKYYSVAYITLDKATGKVKSVSFNLDNEGQYQAGLFGDSIETDKGVKNWELFRQFLDDEIIDKLPDDIRAMKPFHGDEVDTYTGATVTPNNFVRALHSLLDYHEAKYMK